MVATNNKFILFTRIGDLQGWEFLVVTGLWSFFIGLVVLLVAKLLRLFDLDDRIIGFVKQVGRHMMRSKLENFQAARDDDQKRRERRCNG